MWEAGAVPTRPRGERPCGERGGEIGGGGVVSLPSFAMKDEVVCGRGLN